jgi:hypothetical protein
MKKIALTLILLMMMGCGARREPDSAVLEGPSSAFENKEAYIIELEHQVQDLTGSLETLRSDYATLSVENDTLRAQISGDVSIAEEVEPGPIYLCPEQVSMKYQNATGAIAILEGWFAVQPQVRLMQGTYSTTFWDNVNSRIHTIRYIADEDGLTTTDSFLIMFEEAGWMPGTLWMTEQCWLDPPY